MVGNGLMWGVFNHKHVRKESNLSKTNTFFVKKTLFLFAECINDTGKICFLSPLYNMA